LILSVFLIQCRSVPGRSSHSLLLVIWFWSSRSSRCGPEHRLLKDTSATKGEFIHQCLNPHGQR
ncbi:hypothetical protein GE061_020222, partial [Apolygus lucorum]